MRHAASLALPQALQGGAYTGWLATLDARLRIVAALLFASLVVTLGQLPALLGAWLLALVALPAAGLSWRLLTRLLPLALLLSVLLLTLPFSVPGRVLWQVGPLRLSQEGLILALLIWLRASAVLLMLLALVASMEPARFGRALGQLGLPRKLVTLLLLTLRQSQLIGAEYQRLRLAMRARGFVAASNRHTWNSLGWLMGMLLVRSLARARRLQEALRCRGYRGYLPLLDAGGWRQRDSLALPLLGLVLGGLWLLEHLPVGGN
ncbi:MAG: cobalt ECF transporter T component CbiQ [Chromatiaceae bacterium]|nr:MAG: cobalt ECF transporter T component CbiQ [Chromatiaceae bacterium]